VLRYFCSLIIPVPIKTNICKYRYIDYWLCVCAYNIRRVCVSEQSCRLNVLSADAAAGKGRKIGGSTIAEESSSFMLMLLLKTVKET